MEGKMEREADSNISSQRTMNKYDNRYVHAKLLQLCSTLCNPMDYNLPGLSVHGILQARILARILEWAAMAFSR